MHWQMPCWLVPSFLWPAAISSLMVQKGSPAPSEPAEEMRLTRGLFSFFSKAAFDQPTSLSCLADEHAFARKQQEPAGTPTAITGNHIFGCVSLTLTASSWITSWKSLWTRLKSALFEQKQCREKPRRWDLISNFDGSLLACTLLAGLLHTAVQLHDALPTGASQPCCHHVFHQHNSHLKHYSL